MKYFQRGSLLLQLEEKVKIPLKNYTRMILNNIEEYFLISETAEKHWRTDP